MKRLVIFAAFDKQSIVHDYVISYLDYLSKVSSNIIYIADNDENLKELAQLLPYVCHIEANHHGEYDFGSYKRGLIFAKENNLLDDVDEVVFCNDSCFCTGSLENVFKTMESTDCDFWAMTGSQEYEDHLQSFFLVCRKKVFNSDCFYNYLMNVKHQDDLVTIVKTYEIPLKKTLEKEGFKSASYLPIDNTNITFYPLKCFKKGNPLIKRKFFTEGYACRESMLLVFLKLYFSNRKSYNEILSYFSIKSVLAKCWSSFKPKLKRFIYRTEVTRSGKKKYRFLTITFWVKKVK